MAQANQNNRQQTDAEKAKAEQEEAARLEAENKAKAEQEEAEEKAKAEQEEAEEKAERLPAGTYRVAKGRSITSKRGILAEGKTVTAEDLAGKVELNKSHPLVKNGVLVR